MLRSNPHAAELQSARTYRVKCYIMLRMSSVLSTAASQSTPAQPGPVGGLTGLRAVAVLAVLGYHLFPEAVPGGFIGVDVFFVVSGFIVTRLLLIEHARTHRIALGSFWMRRARRILPALVVVLAVCIPVAFAIDTHLLEGIRRQLLGAISFSFNWLAIAADGDYFHAQAPELFTNLWSLGVEEQFYLVAPLLLLLAMGVRLRAQWIAVAALVLAASSAVAMTALSEEPLGSPTRAYFGTDTHAFGLLIGAALAVALGASEIPTVKARGKVAVRAIIGATALLTLAALAASLRSSGWFPAHGGLLVASMAAAALIWAAATTPVLGRALDAAPLRWLGERSYAIYLWHWPLFLILGATPLRSLPLAVAAGTTALSITVAALSFTLVETPFRRASSPTRHPGSVPHRDRTRGAANRPYPVLSTVAVSVLVGPLAVGGALIAMAHDDDASDAEQLVARGLAALEKEPDASSEPLPDGSSPPPRSDTVTAPATPAPEPSAPPPLAGSDITAVGDSVMLAATPALQAKFPGIAIDAEVSRSMWVAPDILSDLASAGALRPVVILGLATNGEVSLDLLGKVLEVVGEQRTLILITGHADRAWIPPTNTALAAFADAHPNVTVADWDAAISARPGDLAGDGIHPQPGGSTIYADMIPSAVDAARAETQSAG